MDANPQFAVRIAETGEAYLCRGGESLLHGMARMGKKGIPLGCRGGGCGVCRVQVVSGDYTTRAMSRSHVSAEDWADACLLACRVYPASDMQVSVVGAMKKNVCRPDGGISKSHEKE